MSHDRLADENYNGKITLAYRIDIFGLETGHLPGDSLSCPERRVGDREAMMSSIRKRAQDPLE